MDKASIEIKKIEKPYRKCPNCNNDAMFFYRGVWSCKKCKYEISDVKLKDGYIYYFCDKCGVFLNVQDSFKDDADGHVCEKCGYDNELNKEKIDRICKKCGARLLLDEKKLCSKCREERNKRIKIIGGLAIGAILTTGATYIATSLNVNDNDDNSSDSQVDLFATNENTINSSSSEVPTLKCYTGKNEKRRILSDLIDLANGRFKENEYNMLLDFVSDDNVGKSITKKQSIDDWCSDGKYHRDEERTYMICKDEKGKFINEHYSYKDDDGQSGEHDIRHETGRDIIKTLSKME